MAVYKNQVVSIGAFLDNPNLRLTIDTPQGKEYVNINEVQFTDEEIDQMVDNMGFKKVDKKEMKEREKALQKRAEVLDAKK